MSNTLFATAVKNLHQSSLPASSATITRATHELTPAAMYQPVLGHSQTIHTLEYIDTSANIHALVIGSPEAEAISGAGAFIQDINTGNPTFTLPRYHFGVPAQFDLAVATHQLAKTPLFEAKLKPLTEHNAGIIYFAREGHMTSWQQAVYLASGKNLPTTLAEIHHTPADNEFTRIAELSRPLNLEGFPEAKLQTLFLCDPVASGMQQIKLIEELAQMKRLPQEIIIIAPMASLYGLRLIGQACRELNVACTVGALAVLLDTTMPLHYYSPYPQDPNQVANPILHQRITDLIGPDLHRWCIRGNWTGSFWASTDFPLADSQTELAGIGLSNQAVKTLSHKITPELAQAQDVYHSLLPYSTKLTLTP
jgi:hypothetical protein